MNTRCISACQEKDRLGIKQGWCWVCVQDLRLKWREESDDAEAQRSELLRIAKYAVNGWACYATRKIEHEEIARLHEAIGYVEAKTTA